MPKKIDWLNQFAQEFATKTSMSKVASSVKVAKEQLIIDPAKVPNCQNGDTVSYNGVQYTIVNASFNDAKGPGVVLERTAAIEDEMGAEEAAPAATETPAAPAAGLAGDTAPIDMAMGAPASSVNPSMGAQEYGRRNPGDVYHFEIRDNVEQPSFQQAADATMNNIKQDWNNDRTSVPGHYTNPVSDIGGQGQNSASGAPAGAAAPMAGAPAAAPAPMGAPAVPAEEGAPKVAAAAGEGPEVPVATNGQHVGYGYGNGEFAHVDPTAPAADMAAQDLRVGQNVGNDWVDPIGHGGGNGTPQVNLPQDQAGDQYPGAKHVENPAFTQQTAPVAQPTPAATPGAAGVAPMDALKGNGAPAPAAAPTAPAAEAPKADAPVADDKAVDDKAAPADKAEDKAEDKAPEAPAKEDDKAEVKANRIAARIAKMVK